jgi:hypothetical protein
MKESIFTECPEEVLPALDPHPPIGGIWIYHSMVDIDTFTVRLQVPGKVL